jgi:hypothetical protein
MQAPPMRTVAIGPETDRPTWYWVGFNLARELTKYVNVRIFHHREPPAGDVILALKEPLHWSGEPDPAATPIVYFLADYFMEENHLLDSAFLRQCSALVVHSIQLQELARRVHPHVYLMDHDDKYVLPERAEFREKGHVLWVGFSDYVAVLRDWLVEHPLPYPLVVLTDRPGRFSLPGSVEQLRWTPARQYEYMRTAKGAIDIKGRSFNQRMKPPEKAQTFIASGIPTACNLDSPVYSPSAFSGFRMADASDHGTWFSREYYQATQQYAHVLRNRMSLEVIGRQVMAIVQQVHRSHNRQVETLS